MVWARLHDRAANSAKLEALSDAAFRVWAKGLVYSADNLTDGHIPTHALTTFRTSSKRSRKTIISELTRVLVKGKGPLWDVVEGGYQIHDYFQWNDSAEKVLHKQAIDRARWRRSAKKQRADTRVTPRDTPRDDPRAPSPSPSPSSTSEDRSTRARAREDRAPRVDSRDEIGFFSERKTTKLVDGWRPETTTKSITKNLPPVRTFDIPVDARTEEQKAADAAIEKAKALDALNALKRNIGATHDTPAPATTHHEIESTKKTEATETRTARPPIDGTRSREGRHAREAARRSASLPQPRRES